MNIIMCLVSEQDTDTALADRPKKELSRISFRKSRTMLHTGTTLASVESLSLPLLQEVVLPADIGCAECQKRVADIMSRMSETESVIIDVLEKTVTLTCRYPPTSRQVPAYRNPLLGKVAMMKRMAAFFLR